MAPNEEELNQEENNESNLNNQELSFESEIPVLTKEDLIYILENLFKFSSHENNAITRKNDGLYVLDFYQTFKNHIENNDIHSSSQERSILNNLSLVNDILYYKNSPAISGISNEEGNAAQAKQDGIYVPDLSNDLQEHIDDTNCHVSNEEKETWNGILQIAKKYAKDLVDALTIYDIQLVESLPEDEINIKETTTYYLEQTLTDSEEKYYARFIYREHKWIPLDLNNKTYDLFARKKYVDDNFVKTTDERFEVVKKFSIDPETNKLLIDGHDLLEFLQISEDPRNALFLGSDNKLFVKDLSSELHSIQVNTSLSKTVILEQQCNQAGIYELEEDINNFNFLLLHYYLIPDGEDENPCDAKMEMVDVDSLNELYENHIDYILEHDYGLSTYNTKIRFYDRNKMQITYYHRVCIYKIVGVN